MGEVARVQGRNPARPHRVDARNRLLERADHVLLIASLLKPICESLIWTKLKLPFVIILSASAAPARWGKSTEPSVPPATVQSIPVPAQAIARQKATSVNAVVFSFFGQG